MGKIVLHYTQGNNNTTYLNLNNVIINFKTITACFHIFSCISFPKRKKTRKFPLNIIATKRATIYLYDSVIITCSILSFSLYFHCSLSNCLRLSNFLFIFLFVGAIARVCNAIIIWLDDGSFFYVRHCCCNQCC